MLTEAVRDNRHAVTGRGGGGQRKRGRDEKTGRRHGRICERQRVDGGRKIKRARMRTNTEL